MRKSAHFALGLAASLLAAQVAADPSFTGLGALPGAPHGSRAYGVSADGCVVVGESGDGFRWQAGQLTGLGPETGGGGFGARAASANGSAIAGFGAGPQAYHWESGVLRPLSSGSGPSFQYHSVARGMSAGGRVIVGNLHDFAFYWDDGDATILYDVRSAQAVSADGRVFAGYTPSPRVAVRWEDGEITQLGVLPGASTSVAYGISADGAVIVGASDGRPFRHEGGVMSPLGTEAGAARDASADGSVIVGEGVNGAFIWDASRGIRDLRDVLIADFGLDLAGWELEDATGISDDGLTVVGYGRNPDGDIEAWRATLGPVVCHPPAEPEFRVLFDHLGDGLHRPSDLRGLALAPDGALWVSADRDLYRVGPDLQIEHVLGPEGADGRELFLPSTARFAPDGTAYVPTADHIVFRIPPSGEADVVLDVSDLPQIPDPDLLWIFQPGLRDLEVDADGVLWAAVGSHVLRMPPGGEEEIVVEQAEADLLADQPGPLVQVEVGAAGSVFIANLHGYVFEREPAGDLSLVGSSSFTAGKMAFRAPDLWLLSSRLFQRLGPEGFETVYVDSTYLMDLTSVEVGPHGNFFATDAGYPFLGIPRRLLRITPSGTVATVLQEGMPGFGSREFEYAWGVVVDAEYVYVIVRDSVDRNRVFRLPLPAPVTTDCSDAEDNDGDGFVDRAGDPGCDALDDESEQSADYACDDGIDNDGDGATDFPADVGCQVPISPIEDPACSDGEDNDGDGLVDHDGAGGEPDPQCVDRPWRNREDAACGIGFELVLLALLAPRIGRRQRRLTARSTPR